MALFLIIKYNFEYVMPIYRGKAKMLISQLDDAQAAVLGASALAWNIRTED